LAGLWVFAGWSEVFAVDDPLKPANLGVRADALWSALVKPTSSIADKVLIGEACRLADRLDTYDAQIASDPEADVAAEARLAAATLARLLAQLQPAAKSAPQANPKGTFKDEVAARRAARQANASG
jgi:hypothetical protein